VRKNQNGEAYQAWLEDLPYLDTPDALWWVEHNNPDRPHSIEFEHPPLVQGTAEPFLGGAALEYSIEGFKQPAGTRTITAPTTILKTHFVEVTQEEPSEGSEELEPLDPEREEDVS